MKIVVVGGSGFVGRHVIDALHARGVPVRQVPAPRIAVGGRDERDLLQLQTSVISDLAKALGDATAVINAAGLPDADSIDSRALDGANGLLPGVIGAAARTAGISRFVHVSSAAVQGTRYLDESSTIEPLSVYARSKAMGEKTAIAYGPSETVIYRPPGVHGQSRKTTKRLARLARSPLAVVASPGTQATPQALAENVGDAIAFLSVSPGPLPAYVIHPSEGLTTASLLDLLGGRPPRHLPKGLVPGTRLLLRLMAQVPFLAGAARRVQVLLVGQTQSGSWLTLNGWKAPYGLDRWRRLGEVLYAEGSPLNCAPSTALIVATVAEQLRVQYPLHVELLRGSGVKVHAAAGASSESIVRALPAGVVPHAVPLIRNLGLRGVARGAWLLRKEVRLIRPDLIVYGSPAAALVGALASWGLVRRRVFVVHGLREETLSGPQRKAVTIASWLTSAMSTDTVFASESTRTSARFIRGRSKGVTVAQPGFIGVPTADIEGREFATVRRQNREDLGLADQTPLVGFVGRLAKDKGIVELVRAIEMIRESGLDAELLLVGAYDDTDVLPDDVVRLIESSAHIHHVDYDPDPYPWYATMDVMCLPSYREGLPTVLLEAGAMRVPVVAARATGIIDALHEDEGYLCRPRSAGALLEALLAALNDGPERRRRTERHHARIRREFSTDTVQEWWGTLYRVQSGNSKTRG